MIKTALYLVTLAVLVLSSSAANAFEKEPLWPEGKTPYAKEVDGKTGKPFIEIWKPSEEKRNGTAMVVCPGGGYGGLAIGHEGHQIAQWLNEIGITAFVLHYRLGPEEHHFPTQLADVQRALRVVRSKCEGMKLDPQRIGVMGFSAGGHLTSMALTKYDEKAYEPSDEIDKVSARPDFGVLCYAVVAMSTEFGHKGSARNLLGSANLPLDSPEVIHVSSEKNVTADTPPTFIFHTDEDTAVPSENGVLFYLALRKHKVPAELHVYQRGPHGVGLFHGDPILRNWPNLLRDWMRTNSFLSGKVDRVAASGEASIDETPVSWGTITFQPENPNLPETTLRIRNGKFKAAPTQGPVIGKGTVHFAAPIADPANPGADRIIQFDRLQPGDRFKLSVEIKPDNEPWKFDLVSP